MPIRRGLTLMEVVVAVAMIALLAAVLLPVLQRARSSSHRERCAHQQAQIGQAWHHWLEAHDDQFPLVLDQPAWTYGGVRFSSVSEHPHVDYSRPLNRYLPPPYYGREAAMMFACPADKGIDGPGGTEGRSAFRAFGTSYRANAYLLNSQRLGLSEEPAPLPRSWVRTAPARMVLMGDAGWHDVWARTGRTASWHGQPGECNLLFLDGSVRFRQVVPEGTPSPLVIEPWVEQPELAPSS